MIKQEKALKFIESFKKKELIYSDLSFFSKKYRVLGLLITKLSDAYEESKYVELKIKPYEDAFGMDLQTNPWRTGEGKKLARVIFGKLHENHIADIWDLILKTPYQNGYDRRSFRSKSTSEYTVKRISYLQDLYNSMNYGFGNLTIQQILQYDVYADTYFTNHSYLFAAYLNDENYTDSLYELIQDIFQGEEEIGGVTRAIVKGLLLTERKENWVLVEKLLLAAQRQEGLRQTILEALDETSVGALEYFINVLQENNLTRFSSVVRAVDTWFGFGWEAPKNNTINKVLNTTLSYFKDEKIVESALKSKDNLEVYSALWFIGLDDADKANLKAIELIQSGNKEKKVLASVFMSETGRTHSSILPWIENNFGNDLELDYWLLKLIPIQTDLSSVVFSKAKSYGENLPSKGKMFEGIVFSWYSLTVKPDYFYNYLVHHANNDQLKLLAENLSVITSEERSNFIRKVFPEHYTWSYYYNKEEKVPRVNFSKSEWKKELAFQAIKDRNESVMGTGIRLFESMDLDRNDISHLEELLGRKNRNLRESIITLILKQPQDSIVQSTTNLIESKKVDQRLAGLEILSELQEKNSMLPFIEETINLYQQRPKISKNEQVYLDKFKKKRNAYSFENGFGAINYHNLNPLIVPQVKFHPKSGSTFAKIVSKLTMKQEFLFKEFINEKKITEAINALVDLYEKHKNFEYEVVNREGDKQIVLLSTGHIQFTNHKAYDMNDHTEKVKYLPLYNVWKEWYDSCNLNDFELLAAIHYCDNYPNQFGARSFFGDFFKQYIPELKNLKLVKSYNWDSVNKKVLSILQFLFAAFADHETVLSFKVDLLEDMIAKIPKNLKAKVITEQWNNRKSNWSKLLEYEAPFVSRIDDYFKDFPENTALMQRYWRLKMYLMYATISYPKNPEKSSEIAKVNIHEIEFNTPSAWLTAKLHKNELINDHDFKYQLLVNEDLLRAVENVTNRYYSPVDKEDIPIGVFDSLKTNLLDVELERGDIPTEATVFVNNFGTVKGTNYLFELLNRLGKETFHRGYYWSNLTSRKESFSNLIKKTIPHENDTLEDFITTAKASEITKKRWIETAMYAPQWSNWISEYLKLEKLEAAVWWFHAHTAEYMNAEKETIVARYSNIDKSDFLNGVIDIDWFNDVYFDLGKQNWKLLHDAAKYISTGNGHRLVKLYSSVMLGEVKIRETLAKIKEKRDKDYVKAFGLIPLSKANKKKDLLNRYNLLQEFLKESKQFGAQRQQSEKTAVEIGLDNLARNAGYDDSIRFSWAMEGEAIQKIMENAIVEIDNIKIILFVNDDGKAELKVEKDGKQQKSIPAKVKKDKSVLALQKNKTYIAKQYKRTLKSLEQAMVKGEEFLASEIQEIAKHPVVSVLLKKLVLFNKSNKTFGFLVDNGLQDYEEKTIQFDSNDKILIAHPAHLYQNVVWDLYQKWIFDHKLKQPFKQVFRELYILTPDEIENKTKSFRYQGHQIQPNKAIALLRSRGWTVNHEDGLQKVFHDKGFIASIYAMADWFSPSDIEAPTIEFVSFYSLKEYKNISLKDIDPIIYSEIMRDVDLVVSVAHVGGVDPEASHSTLEMRAVLAKETARLFKSKNVEVKERHILINGKLGDYSIHLGSGQVSKNGLALSIIPVHSQHRGRLFLPFLDDDPKSAEIISKMKLLSEDNKIKDPTILAQINRT